MSKTIRIPITEEELSRLNDGETFEWFFNNTDIEIYKDDGHECGEDNIDADGTCLVCGKKDLI